MTKAGSQCEVPTTHVDIYPTFCELGGAALPEKQVLDGESLVPLFKDGSASLKRASIFQHFPGYLGAGGGTWRTTPVATVITGDWKLMEFMEDQHLELYNLRADIGERNNLAATQVEKAKAMQTALHTWQSSVGAKFPTKNDSIKAAEPEKKAKGKGKGKKAKSAK